MIDLTKLKPDIETICQNFHIKKLGLFGSVLKENFSSNSDVDVLVDFKLDENIDFFTEYFELKEQLEKIFHRHVDLVIDKHFKNPIFRESVEKTRTIIYEK